MSDWQLAALALTAWIALDLGFLVGCVLFRRHHVKQGQRLCHFCDTYRAHPDDLFCSAVCADAEIGVLGKENAL